MPKTATSDLLTTADLSRDLGVPPWRCRRVVDELALAGKIAVRRVLRVRLLDSADASVVRAELWRRGLIPEATQETQQ